MKKGIFVLALMLGMAFQSNAQEKGQFWVGGTLGFETTDGIIRGVNTSILGKQTIYTITPEFGYAFSDKWAAGIKLGYIGGKFEEDNVAYDQKMMGFNVEPFARYTFLNWKALSLFVDGGLGYAHYKVEENDEGIKTDIEKNNYYGISIDPGFSVRLSNTIFFKGQINFFEVGMTKLDEGGVKTDKTAAKVNSPFNFDNFTCGFEFRF